MFISVSADLFKGKIFGLIYGLVEAVNGLAAAIGAWIGGFFFDKAQSYQMAFVFVIVAFLFSCIFIWLAAPRKFMAIR
jgi:predicted MFS family arabinose efflux permease